MRFWRSSKTSRAPPCWPRPLLPSGRHHWRNPAPRSRDFLRQRAGDARPYKGADNLRSGVIILEEPIDPERFNRFKQNQAQQRGIYQVALSPLTIRPAEVGQAVRNCWSRRAGRLPPPSRTTRS
jgi:hypothetical protein